MPIPIDRGLGHEARGLAAAWLGAGVTPRGLRAIAMPFAILIAALFIAVLVQLDQLDAQSWPTGVGSDTAV